MQVLVCDDGELGDICALLRELGCEPIVRTGITPLADLARPIDLVVATPARAMRVGALLSRPETHSIVVAEQGTRTAGRRLHQLGVEWIVRRPVHPAALRLLLQHSLYRGPERRRAGRVSVGLPIRYRARFVPRRAVLREVSLRGASMITDQALPTGRKISLQMTDADRPYSLNGEVVRCRAAPAGTPGQPGQMEIGLSFDAQSADGLQSLRQLVARYSQGPASYAPATAAPPPARIRITVPESLPGERRENPRRTFTRRVIALQDETSRVLIGRDLSIGGMSVETGAPIEIGQRLRLALYVRAGETPLVVEAEVVRSDHASTGLRFESLTEASREYLGTMLDSLPGIATPSAEAGEERRVVAQVI